MPTLPYTYVFKVNGVTKTLLPGWKITETANGPNQFAGTIQSLDGSFRIQVDDVITLTENGTTIYAGLVDDPQEQGPGSGVASGSIGGLSGSAWIIQQFTALDYNSYAARIAVTTDTSRPSESLAARLGWIAGLLSAQSVTLSGTQATGPTLDAASYSAGQYLIDVLNATMALANGTGTQSWVWEIDYTLVLSSWQAGTLSAPTNIAEGDTNTAGDITVEQPRPSTYANYDIVLGGSGTRSVTDNFTGNGSTVTFALSVPLSTSYGYVTVGGVFETLGTGATWTYNSATNSITRTSAPGVGVAISINYVGQYPISVIGDGGLPASKRVTKTYTAPDVFDPVLLQALANAYVTRDMDSPRTVKFNLAWSQTGWHPGQVLTVNSAKRNLSSVTCLVTQVDIVNNFGNIAQRLVTCVTSQLLPATLRQQFQQTFGTSGGMAAAAASGITVVTGGTYLQSPAMLGGSDTLFRVSNTWRRVPNALPYVAPATMAVKIRGTVAAETAVNVLVRLYDEVNSIVAAGPVTTAAAGGGGTPSSFVSGAGSVTAGNTYWLHMESGTVGAEVTAIGHVEGI